MLSHPQWIKGTPHSIHWLHVIIGLGTIALILGRLTETMADPDLWGYMSFGRLFWSNTDFPYRDIFSYTPTKTLWVYHEWLTGVIFYPIYQHLGAAGLQALKYIIGIGTAFLIYKTARTRGASAQTTVICLLLISPFFSFAYSPLRAQAFTNLFFVFTLYLLEKSKQINRYYALWWLVPLYLLWANLHGGFVAGLGMIGLFAVGELISKHTSKPYWLILVPTTFVTLINPYGLSYWTYLKDALTMPRPDIDEWHSVFFALQNGEFSTNILMFLILTILALLMLITSRRRNFSDILLIIVTSYLAFRHVRHQSVFFLVMGCCGPIYFTRAWDTIRYSAAHTDRWRKPLSVFTGLLFLCLFFLFGARFVTGHPFDITFGNPDQKQSSDYNYPVGAIEFMRKHDLNGNILTEFSWGEYIIWSLPESRVAMDGRYETIYTEKASREYFEFTRGGTGWQDYLRKYPHELILFRQGSNVPVLLRGEPRWSLIYSDNDCVLFLRKRSRLEPEPG